MKAIKNFFIECVLFYIVYIFTFQFVKDYKYDRLARKTTRIARRLEFKRRILKSKINSYVRKTYNIEANSNFIPTKGVNKVKLHKDIMQRYNKEMLDVSLYLTTNLRWR